MCFEFSFNLIGKLTVAFSTGQSWCVLKSWYTGGCQEQEFQCCLVVSVVQVRLVGTQSSLALVTYLTCPSSMNLKKRTCIKAISFYQSPHLLSDFWKSPLLRCQLLERRCYPDSSPVVSQSWEKHDQGESEDWLLLPVTGQFHTKSFWYKSFRYKTQAEKLRKNFVHFKYSLCVNKNNIYLHPLSQVCGTIYTSTE